LFLAPEAKKPSTKIGSIKLTVEVQSYYIPGEDPTSRCRPTVKLIICTFNLPINKEKSKFRITEVVYSKETSGYGVRKGYSRKMYSMLEKENLPDSFPVQIAGYWSDCIHTLNVTLTKPKVVQSEFSPETSKGLFLNSLPKSLTALTEDETQFQIIRKYRTPSLLLNYTFDEG
jgi:hypothetical protein